MCAQCEPNQDREHLLFRSESLTWIPNDLRFFCRDVACYVSETARTKSASIPYAVVSNPGLFSVIANPGKMSVSKYTMEDVPATQASGSLNGTCSGRTVAVTP